MVLQDITERKRSEERRREYERVVEGVKRRGSWWLIGNTAT